MKPDDRVPHEPPGSAPPTHGPDETLLQGQPGPVFLECAWRALRPRDSDTDFVLHDRDSDYVLFNRDST